MGLGGISIWQLLIVLVIVVLLFGTKRLGSIGTDLGTAIRGFRKSMQPDTEAEAKAAGYELKIGNFPFIANGRALGMGKKDGFVKIIADAKYGEILGAHMIGPDVAELQNGLNRLPTQLPALAPDGIFGMRTHTRVQELQRTHQLTSDGIVGPMTWELFTRLLLRHESAGPIRRFGTRLCGEQRL